MVSLDYFESRYVRRTLTDRANLLPPAFALAAALLAAGTYARSGPDSWSYASDIVLRFATLGFPFAIATGPIGRLILGGDDWRVGRWSRMSLLAFAAVYAVFILCVALPYLMTSARMPLATTGFCFFNSFIVCVLAITANEHFSGVVGSRTVATVNRVSVAYFWLVFVFADVAHLYGPHRPDGFFGLSLSLLVAAVLIRFADAFVLRLKAHLREQALFGAGSSWQEKGDNCHFRQARPAVQFGHVRALKAPFGRHARLQELPDPGCGGAVADSGGRE
jgi:hypothetical protein